MRALKSIVFTVKYAHLKASHHLLWDRRGLGQRSQLSIWSLMLTTAAEDQILRTNAVTAARSCDHCSLFRINVLAIWCSRISISFFGILETPEYHLNSVFHAKIEEYLHCILRKKSIILITYMTLILDIFFFTYLNAFVIAALKLSAKSNNCIHLEPLSIEYSEYFWFLCISINF